MKCAPSGRPSRSGHRERDRGLAGLVRDRGERRERAAAAEADDRVVGRLQHAERRRQLAERRGEQQVPAVVPPLREPAGELRPWR